MREHEVRAWPKDTMDLAQRAIEILESLEPVRRHLYTGAIGWLGWDGDADWNIAVRVSKNYDTRREAQEAQLTDLVNNAPEQLIPMIGDLMFKSLDFPFGTICVCIHTNTYVYVYTYTNICISVMYLYVYIYIETKML